MKNKTLLALFFSLFLTSQSQAQETVKVVADPWCPFTCDPAGDKPGILAEVAKEIFEKAGYKFVYESTSWARAVDQTRAGEFNAVMGALVSDAPDFIFPKANVAQQESCFYTLKDSKWKFAGAASFKDFSVGVVKDYSYGDPLDAWVAKNGETKNVTKIHGVDTAKKLRDILVAGRVVAMAEDKSVVSYLTNSDPDAASKEAWKQVKSAGCQKSLPLHVAFSPKAANSKALVEIFDKGVKDLKASGRLEAIRSKYLK